MHGAMYKSVQVHNSALSAFMHNDVVRVSMNMLHTRNLHIYTCCWFGYNISIACCLALIRYPSGSGAQSMLQCNAHRLNPPASLLYCAI